jgi:hypothetical protein
VVVEVMEPDFVSYGGAPLPEATVPPYAKDDAHCACCGSKLTWRVLVKDVASGLHYIFGRTCANAGGVNLTSKEVSAAKRLKAAKAKAARAAIINTFLAEHAAAAAAAPHPFIKGKGLTLADYLTWIRDNKHTAADMTRAVGAATKALGLGPTPAELAEKAKWDAFNATVVAKTTELRELLAVVAGFPNGPARLMDMAMHESYAMVPGRKEMVAAALAALNKPV